MEPPSQPGAQSYGKEIVFDENNLASQTSLTLIKSENTNIL